MATTFYNLLTASDINPGTDTERLAGLTDGSHQGGNIATTSGGSDKQIGDALKYSWYTNPLNAVTISGTVTLSCYGYESNNKANCQWKVVIDQVSNTGTHISNVLTTSRGAEMPTSFGSDSWTATPTSTTLSTGDRLRFRIYATNYGTMGNGYYCYLLDGTASPWTFTETITEYTAASSIKKISGVPIAGVKKVSGMAIAGVKKVSGVSNVS